jgi:hypothetical protein
MLLASGQRRASPTAARTAPAMPTALAWRGSSTACPHSSTLLKQRTAFSGSPLRTHIDQASNFCNPNCRLPYF